MDVLNLSGGSGMAIRSEYHEYNVSLCSSASFLGSGRETSTPFVRQEYRD